MISAVIRKILCIVLPTLVVYGAVLYLAWLSNPSIHQENSLMENLQLFALAAACLMVSPGLLRDSSTAARFGAWMLLLFFLMLLLREIDVETQTALGTLINRSVRYAMPAIAVVATFVWFAGRPGYFFRGCLATFKVTGLWLVFGCLLYLSSWPFDKGVLPIPPDVGMFLEEAVECGATLCFAFVGFEHFLSAPRPQSVMTSDDARREVKCPQ